MRGRASFPPRAPSRRDVLAGLAGLALGAAGGFRPARAATEAESLGTIFARSGLGARCGFIVADLASGAVLETHRADQPFPPASVIKIVTALYALDALGTGYRFRTRVIATGAGDLALAGYGEPGARCWRNICRIPPLNWSGACCSIRPT